MRCRRDSGRPATGLGAVHLIEWLGGERNQSVRPLFLVNVVAGAVLLAEAQLGAASPSQQRGSGRAHRPALMVYCTGVVPMRRPSRDRGHSARHQQNVPLVVPTHVGEVEDDLHRGFDQHRARHGSLHLIVLAHRGLASDPPTVKPPFDAAPEPNRWAPADREARRQSLVRMPPGRTRWALSSSPE